MKFKHLTAAFIPMLMLAACSADDHIGVESPDNSNTPQTDGYIAVNLQLPSVSTTRAEEGDESGEGDSGSGTGTSTPANGNDNFKDGVASEYAVNNGILVLFKTPKEEPDESKAVFYGAYDLGFPRNPEDPFDKQDGNVTSTYKRSVKVGGLGLDKENERLLGLVFLNYENANIALTENGGLSINGKKCAVPSKVSSENTTTPGTGEDNTGEQGGNQNTTRADEAKTTTFGDICNLTAEASKYAFADVPDEGEYARSIFMTNSPLAYAQGGNTPVSKDVKITTLVDLTDGLQIKEQDALDNPAGTIYVERAVAKITCMSFLSGDGNPATEIDGKTYTYSKLSVDYTDEEGNTVSAGLYYTDVEWGLGNAEDKSYIIRRVQGNDIDGTQINIDWSLFSPEVTVDKYRMIGEKSLLQNVDKDNNQRLYRPYFCVDPHFSIDKYTGETPDTTFRKMVKWSNKSTFYCYENVFDVDHMNYGNTTRVGFWVTLAVIPEESAGKPIKDAKPIEATFYTRNTDNKKLYFDVDGKNPLQQNAITELSHNKQLEDIWKKHIDKLHESDPNSGTETFNPAKQITVTTKVDNTGLLSITEIKFVEAALNTTDNLSLLSGLATTYNNTFHYSEYKGGKAFYEVRLKHFGDASTPWNSTVGVSTIAEAYHKVGEDKKDSYYLGRFGLVRNNWYNLNISGLVTLGYPRDPATWDTTWKNTPDDNKDNYIAVRISVLAWAYRDQDEEF